MDPCSTQGAAASGAGVTAELVPAGPADAAGVAAGTRKAASELPTELRWLKGVFPRPAKASSEMSGTEAPGASANSGTAAAEDPLLPEGPAAS